MQHDAYHEALGIIAGICQDYTNLAHRILGDRETGWEFMCRFDHRTLQDAHDKIAATWRSRCLLTVRQMELPIEREYVKAPDVRGHWLKWLGDEVRSWTHDPHLIQLVVTILENQNNPVGYRAEANLNRELVFRYGDVPWNQYIIDAVRKVLDEEDD